jgi:hypothetical protein
VLGRRVRLNTGLTIVAAAGLVLTHTLTAYLLGLCLVVTSPLLLRTLGLRRMAWATATAVAAASLTCWYWLPLLHAGSYTRVGYLAASHPYLDSVFGASSQAASGVFRQDWVFLNDLGRYIVIAQSLLALLLTLALRRNTANAGQGRGRGEGGVPPGGVLFVRALPWVAGFAFLVTTEFGARLLLELPRTELIQFSWRWQVLVSLWCGLALASLPWEKRSAPPAVLALATLMFFSPLLSPSKVQPNEQRRDLPPVLTKEQFEQLQPLNRAPYAGNLLELRPNQVDSHYYLPAAYGRAEVVSGEARVQSQILRTSYREYVVAAATDAVVQIDTYQAPGWSARLNLRPVEIREDHETGLQLVSVPPGTHRLELEYRAPWPW